MKVVHDFKRLRFGWHVFIGCSGGGNLHRLARGEVRTQRARSSRKDRKGFKKSSRPLRILRVLCVLKAVLYLPLIIMKSIINLFAAIVFFTSKLAAQEASIVGAWQSKDGDDETVLICQAGYIVITEFNPVNTAFYYSSGGSYKVIKDQLIASLEFTTNK